jgi:hypothetical protein
MRNAIIFLTTVLALPLIQGCGSNSDIARSQENVSGVWEITLSETQSTEVGGQAPDGPTKIEIQIIQLANGGSVLTSSGGVYGDDIGCDANPSGGNGFWWAGGGWNSWLSFALGTVQLNTIALTLNESQGETGTGSHGQLMFTGTINPDGTMSGDVTDSCVLVNWSPTQATWTAAKISTLPGP